jgi:hypothetical protein
MKKTTRKLVLRKATVRVLSGQALSNVIGGHETDAAAAEPFSRHKVCGSGLIVDAYPQTGPRQCLTAAAYPQSGPKQCLG